MLRAYCVFLIQPTYGSGARKTQWARSIYGGGRLSPRSAHTGPPGVMAPNIRSQYSIGCTNKFPPFFLSKIGHLLSKKGTLCFIRNIVHCIFLDFDIFRKFYVIVQEIPSSSTTFFPFSVSATQSAEIMSAVEDLFFGVSEGSA